MKLKDLGEFALIQRFASRFTPTDASLKGIGDDCAIIPQNAHRSWLVTTDLLIENVHFLLPSISPQHLGHKALAVNLSDIAAMGGTPLYAFLSLGLSGELEVSWLDQFMSGFHALAQEENVLLLGGDTTRSSSGLVINVAVLGEIDPDNIKQRSQAIAGDIICCTNTLGDSAAGLELILKNACCESPFATLIERHHHPLPPTQEGKWLGKQKAVHAMMDLSDGLDSDMHRILEQSKCGADIHLDWLPLSDSLKYAAAKFNWKAEEWAAIGGEDYCLLLTVHAQQYEALKEQFRSQFKRPLYPIGYITSPPNQLRYFNKGKRVELNREGFKHF
jgi:thiamine-monophosphate kinase